MEEQIFQSLESIEGALLSIRITLSLMCLFLVVNLVRKK
jgi:hypothetical protein